MMSRQLETSVSEAADVLLQAESGPDDRAGSIGQLLRQHEADDALRGLQEDLALLQAEQERGLHSLGGALEQLGEEIGAVRTQLAAMAEPLLAAHLRNDATEQHPDPDSDIQRAHVELRLERLEKQVALLMRGMDTVDGLRYQSDVHTRALARLTDLVTEVVRPRPIEGLEPLQNTVAQLEQTQSRNARVQMVALAILGVGLTPGLGALAWLLLRSSGL